MGVYLDKYKKYIFPIIIILIIGLGYIFYRTKILDSINPFNPKEEINMDRPVYKNLENLVHSSDIIVVGQYKNEMTRENELEHIYKFEAEDVLKGNLLEWDINILKEEYFYHKYNKDGILYSDKIKDIFFIPPEFNKDYILFIKYDKDKNIYTGIGEPWEILFDEEGIIKSNAFNREKDYKEISVQKVKRDSIFYTEIIQNINIYPDFIDGKSKNEVVEEIKTLVENTKKALP